MKDLAGSGRALRSRPSLIRSNPGARTNAAAACGSRVRSLPSRRASAASVSPGVGLNSAWPNFVWANFVPWASFSP